ncbi:MAG TPA: HEAT repeat domain-containing protein [Gemmatimonadaceae bacterium]|nr:HEAT repeat domain-containing protein [Gemmatimonadaceae bacterium]
MSLTRQRARSARTVGAVLAGLALTATGPAVAGSAAARVLPRPAPERPLTEVRSQAVPDDSVQVAAFLAAVRGANPVICELASRVVDGNWRWGGHWELGPAGSRDPQVRAIVKWALDHRQNDADIAVLRAAIADSDPCVRRMAAPLLGRIRTPRAVETLLSALRDPLETTREMAAFALAIGKPPSALEPLTAALSDPSPGVRSLAAFALGEIDDPSAIPALTALLRGDRDAEVRRMAAWAIGEIGG